MVGVVSEPTPAKTWRGTPQAEAIDYAIEEAGLLVTHRQVDVILDALKAAGHLATEPAAEDGIQQVLRSHYLAEIVCDHERKQDNARCACSLVDLGWHPAVGEAVDAWIRHVAEMAAAQQKET